MFIVALTFQEDFAYIKRLFHIVIVLSVIGLIVDRFLRKVASKIIIDFNEGTIEFYMCRSGEARKYSFNLIKTISIKKYGVFVFENRKIFYNLGQNEDFNRSIERLRAQAGIIAEK
jgi:L-rhamnose mutarotase